MPPAVLQRKLATRRRQATAGRDATADVQAHAIDGVAGGGSPLPHLDEIQVAFGRHNIRNVQAHHGDAAERANQELGSQAYATGANVAFAGAVDLHTAAHEAAHVVQQRADPHLI